MPAILFGSISAIADTSEIQRKAFNDAFAQHDLNWVWDRDEYRALLTGNGGAARIKDYAASQAQDVDADAVHATKSELFQKALAEAEVTVRPGVAETVELAIAAGIKLGFVTTTSSANIDALFAALGDQISRQRFDIIVSSDDVRASKPDPSAYQFALKKLDVDASRAVAIEDNVGGGQAASAAGIAWVAFPNANTAGHDFAGAIEEVDALDADRLATVVTSR